MLGYQQISLDEVSRQLNRLLSENGYEPSSCKSIVETDNEEITAQIMGLRTCWDLGVLLSEGLKQLPIVYIKSPQRLLLHVSYHGQVCIDDEQGISIDPRRPNDVVAHVLFDAFSVLEKSEADWENGGQAFFNELEGYWECLPAIQKVRSSVVINEKTRPINCYVKNQSSAHPCVYFVEEAQSDIPEEFDYRHLQCVKALYLSLDTHLFPPNPGGKCDTVFFQSFIDSLQESERSKLDNFLFRSKRKNRLDLLISTPRPQGRERSAVGLTVTFNDNDITKSKTITPLLVKRHTAEYMRERGGANLDVARIHIAVVGCGSVGSEIVDTLASIGFSDITLVDYDCFEVENVFRHFLGKYAIGRKKVHAIERELKRIYPNIECHAVNKDASSWIESEDLSRLDIIVLALGIPSLEREIVKRIKGRSVTPSVVVTWLEPLGLGGHALALPSGSKGCLDCLYCDFEGQPVLYPRVSFLEPGQKISRNLTGCTGAFTPYSALHARKTALLAVEEILKLVNGLGEPDYNYWKGDAVAAEKANVRLSYWYSEVEKHSPQEISKRLFISPCPNCRGIS